MHSNFEKCYIHFKCTPLVVDRANTSSKEGGVNDKAKRDYMTKMVSSTEGEGRCQVHVIDRGHVNEQARFFYGKREYMTKNGVIERGCQGVLVSSHLLLEKKDLFISP
jgi:hypothetical protein